VRQCTTKISVAEATGCDRMDAALLEFSIARFTCVAA
jgi:hypothetical protein